MLPDLLVALGCVVLLAAFRWGSHRPIRRRRPRPPRAVRKRPRLPLRRLLDLARNLPTDLLVKDPPEPK